MTVDGFGVDVTTERNDKTRPESAASALTDSQDSTPIMSSSYLAPSKAFKANSKESWTTEVLKSEPNVDPKSTVDL